MYDKNGDSKITLDEFGDVIKSLGLNPSKDQLASLMKEIDLDGKEKTDIYYLTLLTNSHDNFLTRHDYLIRNISS